MGYGDEIMAAGHARTVYERDQSRRVAICDLNGRPRWHELWVGNPIIATPADVMRGEPVWKIRNAQRCRPYIRYPFTFETGWQWTNWRARDHVGQLYLTAAEMSVGARVRDAVAAQYGGDGRFWLIEPSFKFTQTRNKDWGFGNYALLSEVLQRGAGVPLVRALHVDKRLLPHATHLEEMTFRSVLAVLAHAEGYVGTEGGLHHAAAALGKPAVVLFGGLLPPEILGYPTHENIADDGPGSPCGRFLPCGHCRASMARISVKTVSDAVLRVAQRMVAA